MARAEGLDGEPSLATELWFTPEIRLAIDLPCLEYMRVEYISQTCPAVRRAELNAQFDRTFPSRPAGKPPRAGSEQVWYVPAHVDVEALTRRIEAVVEGKAKVGSVSATPRTWLHWLLARKHERRGLADVSDEDVCARLPPELFRQLMPFQREAVRFIVAKHGRALLADEMGLGKTVTALAAAHYYRDAWPLLIIVPGSLRTMWADAVTRWLHVPQERINVVWRRSDVADVAMTAHFDVHIISYKLAADLGQERPVDLKVAIADESHMLRNDETARYRAIRPLLERAKHCMLLSGTPAMARPFCLFPQLAILRPDLFANRVAFGNRYCEGRYTKYGYRALGAAHAAELHLLLTETLLIRRRKAAVLADLPPRLRLQVRLPPPDAKHLARLEAVNSRLAVLRDDGDAEATASGAGIIASRVSDLVLQLYNRTAEAKADAVCEYVADLLENGTKVLIFAHHHAMLDRLQDCIQEAAVSGVRIDGRVPAQQRGLLARKFQEDEETRVAILAINVAGIGLTLTAASVVVFAELTWTPGALLQAEDRVHRIGQQAASVNVHYLTMERTIDDRLWPGLWAKLNRLAQALDGVQQAESDRTERLDALLVREHVQLEAAAAAADDDNAPFEVSPEEERVAELAVENVTPLKRSLTMYHLDNGIARGPRKLRRWRTR